MINSPLERILVTGVCGFLGRATARHFARQGISVFGTDRLAAENAPLADLKMYASLTLPDAQFETLLSDWRPQAVIHCAGRASVLHSMQEPEADYLDGPSLTFFVLDTLRRSLPESRFMFLSSAAVYGNPTRLPVSESDPPAPISAYGFHKLQSEMVCKEFAELFGIPTACARVFSAYGPGLRRQVMWDLVYKALTQGEIVLEGTGQEGRDFVHAHDIACALEAILASAPMQGEAYNVASGEQTTIANLAVMLSQALGMTLPIRPSGRSQTGVPLNWQADISRISALGFTQQIPLAEGISSFVSWVRQEMV